MEFPLSGVRVVDLSTGIAGGYCTKLLADAGAEVVKVEPPDGDPLRERSGGVLFEFLHTSKRGVVLDVTDPTDQAQLFALYADADLVIESFEPGEVEAWGVGPEALLRYNAGATMLSISNFGRGGLWSTKPATEFTLLALSGSTATRGLPGRPYINAGGRIGEWMGGVSAAVAGLAALQRARRTGNGDHVDLSLFETITPTCTNVQSVYGAMTGEYASEPRLEIPSIEPTKDGYVGFCIFTGQQWQDFCVLIDAPDLAAEPDFATMGGRFGQTERILGVVHEYTTARTAEEIAELATMLRVPVAPIGNGANVADDGAVRGAGRVRDQPRPGVLAARACPTALPGTPPARSAPHPRWASTRQPCRPRSQPFPQYPPFQRYAPPRSPSRQPAQPSPPPPLRVRKRNGRSTAYGSAT